MLCWEHKSNLKISNLQKPPVTFSNIFIVNQASFSIFARLNLQKTKPMKKLYSLLLCGTMATGAFAQNTLPTTNVPASNLTVERNIGFDKAKFSSNKNRLITN